MAVSIDFFSNNLQNRNKQMSLTTGIGYLRGSYDPNLHFTENSDIYANLMYPYIRDDGGNTQNVSLSIDILNKDFPVANSEFPEQEWSKTGKNSGNLLLDKLIWGFKETTNLSRDSKSLQNAFCFNKQELTIKILQQGHTEGFINQDYLYSKNTIEVSVVNTSNGIETLLTTFNDLNLPITDDNRSFKWIIPAKDDQMFNNFGIFGLFVLRINVISKFYIDAKRSEKSTYSSRESNSYLQLLTFSSSVEAQDVQPDDADLDIFESAPHASDTFGQLYEKSVFSSLDDLNENEINADQKRAIIADQIAVLFMSQHPVITSDISPSKILGYGGEQALQPQKIIDRAITYSERFDDSIINLVKNRLFGIIANYKTFSFADELNNKFETLNQSVQNILDPPRIIHMDEFGYLSNKMGVEGILFNPYVVEAMHTEVMKKIPKDSIYEVPLYKNTIGIDILKVTDYDNLPLECEDELIKLSFQVIFGEERISSIYYQAWINNNNSYLEFIDLTGETRYNEFDFSSIGGIDCTFSGDDLTNGDILTSRVTITDVDGKSNVFERKLFFPLDHTVPAITEVSSYQRQDGSGLVDVLYYYKGASEINPANVLLSYSTDNITFSQVTTNLIGDVGLGIMPGLRKITWNPSLILTETNDIAFVKITLTDVDENSNAGITESSIVVIDLTTPIIDIRKISLKEEEIMEESSSTSESSYSSFSSDSSSSSYNYSSSSSS
jgi:hypothetical protein